LHLNREHALFVYQIKLVIKENKIDEFMECLLSLSGEFRKEKGFLDFSFYRNIEKKNTYIIIGEWRACQAMEKHFKRKQFSVLIGAARVLAESIEIKIGEISETGTSNWFAKKSICKKGERSKASLYGF
jgi:quinol monooxygenase YgiN